VVIDVDLQDPPELIAELYAKTQEGYEIVYAQRKSREGETWAKLLIAHVGYKLINQVSDISLPRNTGDFRIISRRAIEELRNLKETHGFLRGLTAFVGFKQASVQYNRDARAHGQGNYNRYWGSIKIGMNGLIGYSNFLLTLSTMAGFLVAAVGFVAIAWTLFSKLFMNAPFPMGIPTIICLVLFLGGIQLISIGILGEYIGRIYDEVKQRPQFIVDRVVRSDVGIHLLPKQARVQEAGRQS
jgi:polyisoprenyl-phosphate glycosyltransferase